MCLSLTDLAQCLAEKGVGSYLQNPDQLVVANSNPALPSGNCLWVSQIESVWCIGTWLPCAYLLPKDQSVCEVCAAVFHSSKEAIYDIDPILVRRFRLRRLSDDELSNLGWF
jgi:hypothetical protein